LLVELASKKLGIDRPGDIQTLMPADLNTLNRKQKSDWLGNLIQPMVDTIFRQYTAPQKCVSVSLQHKGVLYKVTIPQENIVKTVQIKLNGTLIHFHEYFLHVEFIIHTYTKVSIVLKIYWVVYFFS